MKKDTKNNNRSNNRCDIARKAYNALKASGASQKELDRFTEAAVYPFLSGETDVIPMISGAKPKKSKDYCMVTPYKSTKHKAKRNCDECAVSLAEMPSRKR